MTRIVSLAGLLVLTIPAAAAPLDPKAAPAFTPFFGGVADAEGKRAYVPGADGGVVALDLETGKALWSSKEAERPLALAGTNLLAYRPVKGKGNAVVVVTLDADDKGKVLRESDAVTFPDWVSVGLTHGRSFAALSRVQDGDLWLRWQARAWYAGGARPTPEIEKAARKNADGAARIDLKTGKVEMLDADKMPAEEGPKVSDEVRKAAARNYADAFGGRKDVHTAGKLAVALDQDKQKLVLRRWELDTGKELEAVPLLEAPAFSWQFAPGGLALVHKALAKEALPKGDYAWWVFDLGTGKEVARFPYEENTEAATVLGPRAYYVVLGGRAGPSDLSQGRTLKAVELKSGKPLWEQKIEPRRMLLPLP
jgi:hypothetical protein